MSKRKRPSEIEKREKFGGNSEIPLPLVSACYLQFDRDSKMRGYGLVVCVLVFWTIGIMNQAPFDVYVLCGLLLFPAIVFILLGSYKIRYDDDGFSIRMGKREIGRYVWSDVSGVADGKKIFVKGKRLFAGPSMYGFDQFYNRARVACKEKKAPSPLSERKQRNRKKHLNK